MFPCDRLEACEIWFEAMEGASAGCNWSVPQMECDNNPRARRDGLTV